MARSRFWLGAAAVLLTHTSTALAQTTSAGLSEFTGLSAENDWPWWRGPSRNGISTATSAPVQFGNSDNVSWRTPVPGRGHSSPIVVGDRVILATADEAAQVQSVLAFDRRTGKQLWKTDVSRGGFASRIHGNNTHASPTVACDGQRLIVVFPNHDTVQATALDLSGKKGWQQTVGPFRPQRFEYGYGPSPVIYKGTVIIAAECDTSSYMAALDRKTGKQVWNVPRPENITYSTPSIAHVAGRDQMFMSGANQVTSYDPATGKQLWTVPGTTAATCGTAVWDGDIVVCSGGYPKSEMIAIRADGSGEVLWRNSQKCYEQSILAYKGYVYALTDNGGLFCWQVADGKEMWRQRLQGPVSASPVLAGGHIYWANELGTMYVFKPNPEKCEIVAENHLGDSSFASPAVSGGKLFLRVATSAGGKRQEYLYCIGK